MWGVFRMWTLETFDKTVKLFFMALILIKAMSFFNSARKTVSKSDTFVNIIFVPVYLLLVVISMVVFIKL